MRVRNFILSVIVLSATVFGLSEVRADEGVFVITAMQAPLYTAPHENSRSSTVLARGRRVQAAGPAQGGFIPVLTRSGNQAWIKESDLALEKGSALPSTTSAADVVEPATQPQRRSRAASSPRANRASKPARDSSPFGLHALTFDFGLSGGSVGGVSYAEANLGLNAYFAEWLAWRNAIFGRFPQTGQTTYGLDTSLRGILNVPFLTAFAGPGYRFVTEGGSAPLVEGGVVLKLGILAIGGGVKVVMTSWSKSGAQNDTQYFVILGGGGSL